MSITQDRKKELIDGIRIEPGRHRLAGGSDRRADRAHHQPDRAFQVPQAGQSLPARSVEDGKSAPALLDYVKAKDHQRYLDLIRGSVSAAKPTARRDCKMSDTHSTAGAGVVNRQRSDSLFDAAAKSRYTIHARKRNANKRLSGIPAGPRQLEAQCSTYIARKSTGAAAPSSWKQGASPPGRRCRLVQYGETSVMATVVADKHPRKGLDFFPLTVHYSGKDLCRRQDPGRLFQARRPAERKGNADIAADRPSDPSSVRRRLQERNAGHRNRPVSRHGERSRHCCDGRGLRRAHLSGIPFLGPIGAARVGYIEGDYVLNPPVDDMADSKLDLVVAGTGDAVMMVESEANELPEGPCWKL